MPNPGPRVTLGWKKRLRRASRPAKWTTATAVARAGSPARAVEPHASTHRGCSGWGLGGTADKWKRWLQFFLSLQGAVLLKE
ncbi:hypothetical protein NDU88_002374 [Pleurodeles waltl]|uniref:Uncharacterized protein n=1 Tax=Pleurodeles waltl TaxID=8319 RepID=A0AAV7RD59_PLEWA|nr:hypothetical protein NDU88_002374 [Pleurodeles waltl]